MKKMLKYANIFPLLYMQFSIQNNERSLLTLNLYNTFHKNAKIYILFILLGYIIRDVMSACVS